MTASAWNPDERALAQAIEESAELLVVCLGEPFHPGAHQMAQRFRAIGSRTPRLQILHVSLARYRLWAESWGAFGVPTALVFRRGHLVRKILGVLAEEDLERVVSES